MKVERRTATNTHEPATFQCEVVTQDEDNQYCDGEPINVRDGPFDTLKYSYDITPDDHNLNVKYQKGSSTHRTSCSELLQFGKPRVICERSGSLGPKVIKVAGDDERIVRID